MKYAIETLSFEDVQEALKSVEIDQQLGKDYDISGDSLTVRGIYDKRDSKSKDRHISKSQAKKGKCHYCKIRVLV